MADCLEGLETWDHQFAQILGIDETNEEDSTLLYLMEFMSHGNFNVKPLLCPLPDSPAFWL